ncbi:MAG: sensor domain-containing protein [Leptospirales bacterium]
MALPQFSELTHPFKWSVVQQKKILLLIILPIAIVSLFNGYISLYKRPHLTQEISQIALINADLQGFNSDIHFVLGSTIKKKGPNNRTFPFREMRGYLLQAHALLLDIQSRSAFLSSGQKQTLSILRETQTKLFKDFDKGRGHFHPNPVRFDHLLKTYLILVKSIEIKTTSTLEELQSTSEEILFLQFSGFFLFVLMTAILLAWLNGYRESLRKVAIYEALNVSRGGIAFLPITLESFLIINKGFEELSGYTSDEIIGVTPPPIDPTFGRPDIRKEIQELQNHSIRFIEFESFLQRKDKTPLPVYIRMETSLFEGFLRLVLSIEDRSQHKILQDQLQSSRNHFESLIRNMGEGLLELSPDGRILSLNQTAKSLLGYRSDEISGKQITVLLSPPLSSQPNLAQPISGKAVPFLDEIRQTLQPFESEDVKFLKQDGTMMSVSVVATPIFMEGSTDLKGIVVVFRNISVRKRIETMFKKSEEKYRKIVRNAPDGIYLFDPNSLTVLDANPIFCDMLGFFFREALIGKEITEFYPASESLIQNLLLNLREKGSVEIGKAFYKRTDHTSIPVSLNATIIPYEEKEAVLVTVRNITLQMQTEGIRKLFHELDQKILEGVPIEKIYPQINSELLKLFPFALSGIFGYISDARIHALSLENDLPGEKDFLKNFIENMINDPNFSSATQRVLTTGKQQTFGVTDYKEPYRSTLVRLGIVSSTFFPIALPGEKPIATIGISVRKKESLTKSVLTLLEDLANKIAVAHLHENEQTQIRLQKMAIEQIDTPMFITSPDGTLEWANQAYLTSKEHSIEEIALLPDYFFNRLKEEHCLIPSPWETLNNGMPYQTEYTAVRKDSSTYPVEIRITPILGGNGEIQHLVCIETNQTTKKLQEAELRQKAYFDPLTQLPNRSMMENELSESLAIAKRYTRSMAVLFLDLDGFKEVNDSYGHEMGDKLLVAVAERLRGMLRQGDFVARLGGDEFVILLNNIYSLLEVEKAAWRILETVNQPYLIEKSDIRIGTSIGISVYPHDDKDESGLLRDADLAMYQAKNHGKNNYVIYTPSAENNLTSSGSEKYGSIPNANSFLPSKLIPIRTFKEGRIVGFSLKLQARNSDGQDNQPSETDQFLSPDYIQHILESTKEAAEATFSHYPQAFLKTTLSIHQMMIPNFSSILKSVFGNLSEPFENRILFGIRGEKSLPSAIAYQKTTWDLVGQGFKVGLEGVGDQENTLYLLRHLPIQFLELSSSLIKDIEYEAESMAFLSAILLMGHALQRNLLVPAIDDLETALILERMGCDWGLGKIVGMPVSLDRIALIEHENSLFKILPAFTRKNWDMGEIPYLLGRKNHRTLIGKVHSVLGGEGISGELHFALDSQSCPLEHWLTQESAKFLLTPFATLQIQELEERFHHGLIAFQKSTFQNDKVLQKKNGESLLGVYAEIKRALEPLEENLFGNSIPDNF